MLVSPSIAFSKSAELSEEAKIHSDLWIAVLSGGAGGVIGVATGVGVEVTTGVGVIKGSGLGLMTGASVALGAGVFSMVARNSSVHPAKNIPTLVIPSKAARLVALFKHIVSLHSRLHAA